MKQSIKIVIAATALAGWASAAAAADKIVVGNLVDFTGRTAVVGKVYGQAKVDAMAYINANGGINGKQIEALTLDYSYEVPRAIAAYKKWKSQVVAIQGWGTGDTEAMISFVASDQIPYYSASYSAHLTDPTGKGPETKKPAPYNYFYGPSYSDGVRALIQWAADDAKSRGIDSPKYVHMGDNHPYPNAPMKAGEEYAKELGFEVLPAIQYSLKPGDFKAQCLSLNNSGAHYAFLANTSGSNVSLLKSCSGRIFRRRCRLGHGRGQVGRRRPRHGAGPRGLQDVRSGPRRVPGGSLPARRLLGLLHEGGHGGGRRDGRRHQRPQHQGRHVPEEGLGSSRAGRRLPAGDLDFRGPPRRHGRLRLPRRGQGRRG
jgi:hypothetical protein